MYFRIFSISCIWIAIISISQCQLSTRNETVLQRNASSTTTTAYPIPAYLNFQSYPDCITRPVEFEKCECFWRCTMDDCSYDCRYTGNFTAEPKNNGTTAAPVKVCWFGRSRIGFLEVEKLGAGNIFPKGCTDPEGVRARAAAKQWEEDMREKQARREKIEALYPHAKVWNHIVRKSY